MGKGRNQHSFCILASYLTLSTNPLGYYYPEFVEMDTKRDLASPPDGGSWSLQMGPCKPWGLTMVPGIQQVLNKWLLHDEFILSKDTQVKRDKTSFQGLYSFQWNTFKAILNNALKKNTHSLLTSLEIKQKQNEDHFFKVINSWVQ